MQRTRGPKQHNCVYISPENVRFSQDTIGATFSNGKLIGATLDDLVNMKIFVPEIPPISVAMERGVYYTLNNRRLWVFKQLYEMNKCHFIPCIVSKNIPFGQFTTEIGGHEIIIRGDHKSDTLDSFKVQRRREMLNTIRSRQLERTDTTPIDDFKPRFSHFSNEKRKKLKGKRRLALNKTAANETKTYCKNICSLDDTNIPTVRTESRNQVCERALNVIIRLEDGNVQTKQSNRCQIENKSETGSVGEISIDSKSNTQCDTKIGSRVGDNVKVCYERDICNAMIDRNKTNKTETSSNLLSAEATSRSDMKGGRVIYKTSDSCSRLEIVDIKLRERNSNTQIFKFSAEGNGETRSTQPRAKRKRKFLCATPKPLNCRSKIPNNSPYLQNQDTNKWVPPTPPMQRDQYNKPHRNRSFHSQRDQFITQYHDEFNHGQHEKNMQELRDEFNHGRREQYMQEPRDEFNRGQHEQYMQEPRDEFKRGQQEQYMQEPRDEFKRGQQEQYMQEPRDEFKRGQQEQYMQEPRDEFKRDQQEQYMQEPRDEFKRGQHEQYMQEPRDEFKRGQQEQYMQEPRDEFNRGQHEQYMQEPHEMVDLKLQERNSNTQIFKFSTEGIGETRSTQSTAKRKRKTLCATPKPFNVHSKRQNNSPYLQNQDINKWVPPNSPLQRDQYNKPHGNRSFHSQRDQFITQYHDEFNDGQTEQYMQEPRDEFNRGQHEQYMQEPRDELKRGQHEQYMQEPRDEFNRGQHEQYLQEPRDEFNRGQHEQYMQEPRDEFNRGQHEQYMQEPRDEFNRGQHEQYMQEPRDEFNRGQHEQYMEEPRDEFAVPHQYEHDEYYSDQYSVSHLQDQHHHIN